MTKLMLICAESSGDFLAAELVDSLRIKDSNIEFVPSLVADQCQQRGIETIAPLGQFAKMGLTEIFSLIPKVFALRQEILKRIADNTPEYVILVDGFALTHFIARKIKKKFPKIKLIKYIAPKMWAWGGWRAHKLGIYDQILCCLPFEVDFYAKKDIPVTFVGHSVTQRFKTLTLQQKQTLKDRYQISVDKKIIVLLPGSRHSELSRLKEIFLEVGARFPEENYQLVIPIASGKESYFTDLPLRYLKITDTEARFKIFQVADAALAASGTVSLELMLAHVPTVIAYKMAPLSAFLARFLIHVPYATLLNIMLNREVFPEFIQEKCVPDALYKALEKTLNDMKYRHYIQSHCKKGVKLLSHYDEDGQVLPANIVAADAILSL